MFKVTNLSVERNRPIINDISFSVNKGKLLCVVGKSGVGKSTLLHCLAGLIPQSQGTIVLNHQKQNFSDQGLIPGYKDVVLMNQDFALDNYHLVEENLKNACSLLPTPIQQEWVNELLTLFELNHLKKEKAIHLSGGEQQRLAFAVALAKEPSVLLLDEPFSNMDVHLKDKVMNYLILLKKRQKTAIIMVTHNGQEALNISDHIVFLEKGKMQRFAQPKEVYFFPFSFYEAVFFGKINEIKINREKLLFRPQQYEIEENKNAISIEIQFKRKHFYGIFELYEYSYKKTPIYLLQKNDVILEKIFVTASNEKKLE
ncbi:MAG: ABC transporter ATP-binding protein [Flavobacteriia bacterium]|nr:ABC transporter ATP-binding protein [Flavobacteriia bacterium]